MVRDVKTILVAILVAVALLTSSAAADAKPKAAKHVKTYAAIGDSITAGATLDNPAKFAYPNVVGMESLGHPGQAITVSAWAWGPMQDGFKAMVDFFGDKPDVAFLEAGVNDLSLGQKWWQVRNGMLSIIDTGKDMGVKVVLTTITPAGDGDPLADQHNADRQDVNHWIRNSGIPYVDFNKALRKGDPATAPLRDKYNSGDGLHPNGTGHAAMAAALQDWLDAHS